MRRFQGNVLAVDAHESSEDAAHLGTVLGQLRYLRRLQGRLHVDRRAIAARCALNPSVHPSLKETDMPRKSQFTDEQTIRAVREVDAVAKSTDVCRRLGVTEKTF